jgi:hypothetical protein
VVTQIRESTVKMRKAELEAREVELKDRQAAVMIGLDTRRQTIPGELSPTYQPGERIPTAL